MLKNINLNKILQYIAQIIAVYLIFKYVPSQSINNHDIIIITIIITLFCILMENIVEPSTLQKEQICSTICSNKKKENMTSVPQENVNNESSSQVNINQVSTNQVNVNQELANQVNVIQTNDSDKNQAVLSNNQSTEILKSATSNDDTYYSSLFPATYYKIHASDNIERVGSRAADDLVRSDMPYNDYNHLPIPKNYVTESTDYGYSFLPPEKWYPEPPFPPVCVTEKRCPVVPLYTTGTNINLKDWDNSRRVTPPDNINTKFVKEVLNSGK